MVADHPPWFSMAKWSIIPPTAAVLQNGRLATLFTSGIKLKNNSKKLGKTIVVYLLMTLLSIAVNLIYGLFGHGVHSVAMTGMFLYPLLGGRWGIL